MEPNQQQNDNKDTKQSFANLTGSLFNNASGQQSKNKPLPSLFGKGSTTGGGGFSFSPHNTPAVPTAGTTDSKPASTMFSNFSFNPLAPKPSTPGNSANSAQGSQPEKPKGFLWGNNTSKPEKGNPLKPNQAANQPQNQGQNAPKETPKFSLFSTNTQSNPPPATPATSATTQNTSSAAPAFPNSTSQQFPGTTSRPMFTSNTFPSTPSWGNNRKAGEGNPFQTKKNNQQEKQTAQSKQSNTSTQSNKQGMFNNNNPFSFQPPTAQQPEVKKNQEKNQDQKNAFEKPTSTIPSMFSNFNNSNNATASKPQEIKPSQTSSTPSFMSGPILKMTDKAKQRKEEPLVLNPIGSKPNTPNQNEKSTPSEQIVSQKQQEVKKTQDQQPLFFKDKINSAFINKPSILSKSEDPPTTTSPAEENKNATMQKINLFQNKQPSNITPSQNITVIMEVSEDQMSIPQKLQQKNKQQKSPLFTPSFNQLPQKESSFSLFKQTSQKNIDTKKDQKNIDNQQKKDEEKTGRDRTPTFMIPKQDKTDGVMTFPIITKQNKFNKQARQNKEKTFFKLRKLYEVLSSQDENMIAQNAQKIQTSFRKYLTISKNVNQNTIYEPEDFQQYIKEDEGVNKFLNDFTTVIARIYQIPQDSYRLFGELFYKMLQQERFSDQLFDGVKLKQNQIINKRIYRASQGNKLILMWEENQSAQLICQFIRYFSSLTTQCLKRIENQINSLKKTTIYQLFLQTTLLLNERIPRTENTLIIQSMKASDLRLSNHLNKIINILLESWLANETNIQFITRDHILKLIPIVNELPISPSTKLFQKILLKALNLDKVEQKISQNRKIIDKLAQTNCKLLLPFRVILHRLDRSKKPLEPYQKDLFEQIDGFQWVDWLSLYLGEDNLRLNQKQVHYLIKAMKTMRIKNIDKITSKQSQIRRLIHLIMQEGQVKNFYQTLSTIIYDENSIKKVEKQFFNEGRIFNDDLRLLADEIRKFPNCQYNEQDIPQLHAKSLYFLTILAISPERALQYENALFDMLGFIDNISDRCDRVCHLIIDILAYFSVKQFDDQIIIKCFDAMISLISTNSTRQFMTLAMNVNRPQMSFFNKNIPKRVLQKIDRFLTQIMSSRQFYQSTRVSDQSINLSRAYPFRYSIQKYLGLTTTYTPTIPLYWFSNCLKMSTKQSYNPELFQTILSRLLINPSKTQLQQIPYVLVAIVEACNTSNFWKDLNDHLTASNYYLQNKFGVYNKYLTQKPDFQVMLNVFSSLNLLKTMLKLRRIRNVAQRSFPKHFISQLLSSLICLNELDRQYMQGATDIEVYSTRNISPIVGLLSLTSQDSVFINTTASVKTQWLYSRYDDINIQQLKKLHSKTAQNLDYQILRDILVHPHNKHLDCYENISSLAYTCLNQILSCTNDISIQGLLYMCIPKNKQSSNIQDFNYLKAQIIGNFIKALDSPIHSLNRHSWKLLTMIRNSSQNKRLAQQIFREYNKLFKRYGDKAWNMKYLVEFLSYQVKQGCFNYSDLITDLLESMQKSGIEDITKLLDSYQKKSIYPQSLHQFQRLILERKIISVSQKYQIVNLMNQIILNELYLNGSMYFGSLTQHSSMLIKVIADGNLPSVYRYGKEGIPNLSLEDFKKGPRLCGPDILQVYITNNENMNPQQLIEVQIQNVMNWCNRIMDELNKNITTFLSVILSIDETYYSNHTMKIKSRGHPQIFCQLHIPVANYSGQELVGKNQNQSILIIKILIDQYLGKIQKLKQIGHSNQIVKTYRLIDMLLEWFKCCKNAKRTDLNFLCKKVLTVCFSGLGGAILQPNAAKLLLTCTNILQSQLTEDIIPDLKETIIKTLQSVYTLTPDIKQELLILLLIVPPEKQETNILELVSRLWCYEQNNEYFYNQSRVMIKLCELYPIEMAKFKILSKCERILRFSDSALQGVRYRQGMRTVQSKSWIWILKVATCLLEYGGNSTIVVHQVSKFIQSNKKRLIFTFNEPRQSINLKNKIKNLSIELSLAQLDQLEASLQLFIVLSQSKMWVEMNRVLFEEMFYYLMHRTVVVFAPSSMGDRLKKRYIPFSINQKVMWKLHAGEGLARQQYEQMAEGYDPDRVDDEIATQLIDFASLRPSVFILGMSLRFNECLKLWLLACSNGMRCSCFVREYFTKPITTDFKGSTLKYSLTHWDHHNKAIAEIIQSLISRIKEWGKWEDKAQLLNLLNDSFSSAQFFTEAGYLYSIARFPKSDDQLIAELGQSLSLALEMGACHLASQIYFRNKNGTFSKENLQNFQEKLLRLQALGKQKLIQNKISRQDAVFDHLQASKTFLKQIQI